MLLFLLFVGVSANLNSRALMLNSDMEKLKTHPMKIEALNQSTLEEITADEWYKLVDMCPKLELDANINIYFDESLISTDVLAWCYHSLKVVGDVLMPTRNDMTIGVNPEPVNGWHISENCTNISYRYDLRTVLRHELLHGVGMGSSIMKTNNIWSIGETIDNICYPRYYDTLIEDIIGDKIIDGCSFKKNIQSQNIYINDVKLFNPIFYNPSSISHHVYAGELMFWQLPPMECIKIASHEFKILSAMGLDCPGSAPKLRLSIVLLLMPLMLVVFFF